MTDREKAIVETYTGFCMLTGNKRNEVYKYMAEIMGRPVYTHELADNRIQQELMEKAKPDFIKLCTDQKPCSSEDKWIPCSERMPEEMGTYLVTLEYKEHGTGVTTLWYHGKQFGWDLRAADVVIAWQPLPEPYKAESENEECL